MVKNGAGAGCFYDPLICRIVAIIGYGCAVLLNFNQSVTLVIGKGIDSIRGDITVTIVGIGITIFVNQSITC